MSPAPVATAPASRLSPPPAIRFASSREPTASDARTDTVIAVPKAMANAEKMPAIKSPWLSAKIITRMAPVHGLMPTENAMASALVHGSEP